jgi:ubiquinone/menaquinone biosynthesis C-methylase UbiE
MTDLDFLNFDADFSAPAIMTAYDELPLWSAMFGLLLLDEVPLTNARTVLDVGSGTGFPLIELAERLGPSSAVHGIDPWKAGVQRTRDKIAARGTPNATIHEGTASAMPFDDATFDLIVSNLGVNNFDDRDAAIRECRRVSRLGARIALTTNLQGHMRELYAIFAAVLHDAGDNESLARLQEHVEHRATISAVRALLDSHRFLVSRVVERENTMRFANGTALFNHHFIKLGFLDAWKKVVPGNEVATFTALLNRLNEGEIRLTIPMAYVEAVAV